MREALDVLEGRKKKMSEAPREKGTELAKLIPSKEPPTVMRMGKKREGREAEPPAERRRAVA